MLDLLEIILEIIVDILESLIVGRFSERKNDK